MNSVLPSTELPEPPTVDRVRLIRRSMRCFVFGSLGIVPVFGMALGCLALRLWREVAAETGELLRPIGAGRYAIALFALGVALLMYYNHADLVNQARVRGDLVRDEQEWTASLKKAGNPRAARAYSTRVHAALDRADFVRKNIESDDLVLGGCVLAMGFLMAARQVWLLFWQYCRTQPAEWNPARLFAYCGAGLAYAGLVLSFTLIVIVIGWALH